MTEFKGEKRWRTHRRHDIIDGLWDKLESHLPGRRGKWGGIAKDIINAVVWIFRAGTT